jgi:hypothetical protein
VLAVEFSERGEGNEKKRPEHSFFPAKMKPKDSSHGVTTPSLVVHCAFGI